MRKIYSIILRKCFSRYVIHTRDRLRITQEEMSELLRISNRSYIDLEHEKATPSGLSFALYLAYLCEDPNQFAEELRIAFNSQRDNNVY